MRHLALQSWYHFICEQISNTFLFFDPTNIWRDNNNERHCVEFQVGVPVSYNEATKVTSKFDTSLFPNFETLS
jgi:hypothetical protein